MSNWRHRVRSLPLGGMPQRWYPIALQKSCSGSDSLRKAIFVCTTCRFPSLKDKIYSCGSVTDHVPESSRRKFTGAKSMFPYSLSLPLFTICTFHSVCYPILPRVVMRDVSASSVQLTLFKFSNFTKLLDNIDQQHATVGDQSISCMKLLSNQYNIGQQSQCTRITRHTPLDRTPTLVPSACS